MTGTIKDAITGEPLPNANIFESDATGKYIAGAKGTTTNENGIYNFSPVSSHITASYTGYKRHTQPSAEIVSFQLQPATNTLPEVVITAKRIISKQKYLWYAAAGLVIIATYIYLKRRK